MDNILFGAGLKRVLGAMVTFALAAILAISTVGYLQGTASADQLALTGATLGAVSIGGLSLMLIRELRRGDDS